MKKFAFGMGLILLLGCIFLGSCGRGRPKGVISKGEMVEVLVDYHIAYNIAADLPPEKRYQTPLILKGALHKHQLTEAEFDSSLIWYTRNPTELSLIYTRVNRILAEKAAELGAEGAAPASAGTDGEATQNPAPSRSPRSGDSVDVWQLPDFCRMSRLAATRRLEFVLTPDSTYRGTDRIDWEFDARFLPASGQGGKALMFILARYAPDSVAVSSRMIHTDGHYTLTLQNDSARSIRQLWGFIHYFPEEETARATTSSRLFADRIRLMRYHKK